MTRGHDIGGALRSVLTIGLGKCVMTLTLELRVETKKIQKGTKEAPLRLRGQGQDHSGMSLFYFHEIF